MNKKNDQQSGKDNWIHDVSRYLYTRQAQIAKAYTEQQIIGLNPMQGSASKSVSIDAIKNIQSLEALFLLFSQSLFSMFFLLLAEALEEGHTVFSLTEHNPQSKQPMQTGLLSWQMDMLNSLLGEEGFDSSTGAEQAVLYERIDPLDLLNSVSSMQGMCSQDDNNRFKLLKNFMAFFEKFNELIASEQQGLEIFGQQICHLPFFMMITPDVNNNHNDGNDNYSVNKSFKNGIQAPIVARLAKNMFKSELTFWLQRSWYAEQSIINHIHRLINGSPPVLDLSHVDRSLLNGEQRTAIETANHSAFCIITGGPGTGKTYTVAQLVIALHHANERSEKAGESSLSLVLSAPTGKAAQRMQESLQDALDRAGIAMRLQEAKTIHRLLGIGQSGIPRYSQNMPLSEDVIIVDEASMLGVEMAHNLLSAVKTGARLILLGDSHQLSAVEAGAVLSDLCQLKELQSTHANLVESRRFRSDSAVGQFANFINSAGSDNEGDTDSMLHELFSQHTDIRLYNIASHSSTIAFTKVSNQDDEKQGAYLYPYLNRQQVYQQLIGDYQAYFELSKQLLQNKIKPVALVTDSIQNLMQVFNRFRVLTLGHHSAFGDEMINEVFTQYHRKFLALPVSNNDWYHGRPIMVRRNNYALGLFNGDIGICVQSEEGLAVYFEGREQFVSVSMLSNLAVSTAYAMTVHKSQGSEFDHVAVLLNGSENMGGKSHLLSREMLYTGVTRAKKQVSIYSTIEDVKTAIASPTIRRTGLAIEEMR